MRYILLVLLMIAKLGAGAQQATQIWSHPADVGLQWTHIATDGILITAVTNEFLRDSVVIQYTTLRGIDPAKGNIKWTYTSPDSSLITGVEQAGTLPYLKLRTALLTIIDPSDGRVIIAPELFGEVYQSGFLPSGLFWVEGNIGNTRSLSMFDLQSGKRLWSRSEYFDKPNRDTRKKYGITRTLSMAATKIAPPDDKSYPPALLCAPIVYDNEHLILASGDRVSYNDIYKVSVIDGDTEWKTAGPPMDKIAPILDVQQHRFGLIAGQQQFFFVREHWIAACSYENGAELWKEHLKIKGDVDAIFYDQSSMVLFLAPTHLVIVDEQTGVESSTQKLAMPCNYLTVDAHEKMYSYCREERNLYEIDKIKNTATVINKQPINFRSTDNPDHIEPRKDGVLLYSDQNVALIEYNGTTRYINHYNKVSEFKTEFFKGLENTNVGNFSTGDLLVLLTSTNGNNTLEIVNKDSGQTVSMIGIAPADSHPVFQLDQQGDRLFYIFRNTITAFEFRK